MLETEKETEKETEWEISIEHLLETQVHAIQHSWNDPLEQKMRFRELRLISAGIIAGMKEAKR